MTEPLCERWQQSSAPIAWRSGRPVSRRQFVQDAACLSKAMPEDGHIINLCRDRYYFAVSFVAACLRGKANLLPGSESDAVIAGLRETYSLTAAPIDDAFATETLNRTGDEAADWSGAVIPGHQVAAIAFTSGSSGAPRAHPKSWGALLRTASISSGRMFSPGPASLVATVPAQHMFGLEFSVMASLVGPYSSVASIPFYPADIARALADVPPPRILITTPLHLKSIQASAITMPKIACVLSATAPLDAALAKTVEDTLHCPVSEIYGCTEAGSVAARQTVQSDGWTLHPGSTLSSTKDRGVVLNADHLDAPVPLQDRIEILSEHRFRLLGRDDDLIKVAGKRASLADLNRRLNAVPGVQDGVVFMPGEHLSARPAALVVAPDLDSRSIQRALAAQMDPVFVPRPLKCVSQLPRDALGKLPMQALQAALSETGCE